MAANTPAKKAVKYIGWADGHSFTKDDVKKLGFEGDFTKTFFPKNVAVEVDPDLADRLVKSDQKSFTVVED